MTITFGEAALRLAGAAGALFGWRPDEFWAATPAELATLFGALLPEQPAVLSRGDLDRLQRRFPD